jgi:hypothetical protein
MLGSSARHNLDMVIDYSSRRMTWARSMLLPCPMLRTIWALSLRIQPLAPHETDRDMRPERERLLRLCNLPITCSVFAGFVIIGRQFRSWLVLGYWPTIALHDVLNWWVGRPISTSQMVTGLFDLLGWPDPDGTGQGLAALDAVMRWILDGAPLAFWLIVILPAIWLLIWISIFKLFGFPRRTPEREAAKSISSPTKPANGGQQ